MNRVRQALIQRMSCGDVKYASGVTNSRAGIVLEYSREEVAIVYRQPNEGESQLPGP
jgi:hypothetical protein